MWRAGGRGCHRVPLPVPPHPCPTRFQGRRARRAGQTPAHRCGRHGIGNVVKIASAPLLGAHWPQGAPAASGCRCKVAPVFGARGSVDWQRRPGRLLGDCRRIRLAGRVPLPHAPQGARASASRRDQRSAHELVRHEAHQGPRAPTWIARRRGRTHERRHSWH